ncbi:hypothetical protein FRB99_005388 [Tulasnella sp. 403]|nr:hypothetical protein FRB99_005388 [Tulasnella sp. 403]
MADQIVAASDPLLVPEILSVIISFLYPGQQCAAARVNRLWHDIACDHIWESLYSLRPLLVLLGSPVQINEDEWDVVDGLSTADWTRFRRHAAKVRVLVIESADGLLSNSTVVQLLCGRISGVSDFKRLQHLTFHIDAWRGMNWESEGILDHVSTLSILPFYSENLRRLEITLPGTDFQDLFTMMRSLQRMSPPKNLRSMSLGLPTQVEEEVTDQSYLLDFFAEHAMNVDDLHLCNLWDPSILANAFKSFPHLQKLSTIVYSAAPTPVRKVFESLGTCCPHLAILDITLNALQSITFDVITPLLRCHNLTQLKIISEVPLVLTPPNIKRMGKSWTRLSRLHLVGEHQPGSPGRGTSFSLLSCFASFFPASLQHLNHSFVYDTVPLPQISPKHRKFPRLETLNIYTPIPTSRFLEMGEFLGMLCPPGIQLQAGTAYSADASNAEAVKLTMDVIRLVHRVQGRAKTTK